MTAFDERSPVSPLVNRTTASESMRSTRDEVHKASQLPRSRSARIASRIPLVRGDPS